MNGLIQLSDAKSSERGIIFNNNIQIDKNKFKMIFIVKV